MCKIMYTLCIQIFYSNKYHIIYTMLIDCFEVCVSFTNDYINCTA